MKTRVEAEDYICLTNVREGLLIKNKFTIFEDRVLVELPGDKLLICDYDDIDLVESHTWYCQNTGYAVTHNTNDTKEFFHNMVMKHQTGTAVTVDHINRNGLDNHKSNLPLVDQRTQSINRGLQINNKSGVTGVYFVKKSKSWVAYWKDADGNQCYKWYSSNKYGNAEACAMAIKHRAWMIRSLPHYREAPT